ncbi:hypothetical protein, partial [Streptomyces sp. PSAA01]|uniref:hypothetical protein n=1 Tax=Streptomyces sp. PSAA01 TaxID=2912762 RepID=UPI001F346676
MRPSVEGGGGGDAGQTQARPAGGDPPAGVQKPTIPTVSTAKVSIAVRETVIEAPIPKWLAQRAPANLPTLH